MRRTATIRCASCRVSSLRPRPEPAPAARRAQPGAAADEVAAAASVHGGPAGPVMPSVSILDEALRWPGKDLALKQSGGIVTFTSDGVDRVCRPAGPTGTSSPAAGGDDAAHARRPRTVAAMCRRPSAAGMKRRWSCNPAIRRKITRRSSSASASRTTGSGSVEVVCSRAAVRAALPPRAWDRSPASPGVSADRLSRVAVIKKPGVARLLSPHAFSRRLLFALSAMIGLFYFPHPIAFLQHSSACGRRS